MGQINAQAIGRRHAGGAAQRKATHTRALDHDLACGRCERAGATGSQTAGDVHAHIALGLHRCCATPFNLAIGLQQHIAPSRQRAAACPRHHACAQHQTQVVCNRANAVGTHQDKITAVHLQQGFAGGLNSGALQHRLAVGAVQRQIATDRDEPQIDRVTVKHLDILRTLDAQVDPVVACPVQDNVTARAQTGPCAQTLCAQEAVGIQLCNAAQLAAQTQITPRRNLAQTQQRPTALYADVQLVVHIGTEHAQTTLHNAQPDVSTTGRGKGLVQADLGVCGAGELNKSAATAGLQSADPLSVHIQLCAHKTRAHRLPFELGQDATADDDVFVVNAFASAVVCDGTQLGDHARIATAVGRCAQHHQTRQLQIAVRIEIGRAQSRGDRAIIKAQPSAQHVVAQVTGAVRACDTQVTGGQLHGQIT